MLVLPLWGLITESDMIKRYSLEWTREGVLRVQENPHGQYMKYEDMDTVVGVYEDIIDRLERRIEECLKKNQVS